MAELISDSELLDLNGSTTGYYMENQPPPNTAPTEWIDTQSNSQVEVMTQTT